MRKSVRYALLALLLCVVAIFVLPAVLLDKGDIKRRMSQAVFDATGRELSIGDIGVSLLPTPRVTIDDVRLANWSKSAEPWMIEIPNVTVVVAPMDLLHGKVTARTVRLDTPRVVLETRGGDGNWEFLPSGKMPTPIAQAPGYLDVASALQQGPVAAGFADAAGLALGFETIEVRDGQILFHDAGQESPLSLDQLKLDVIAQSMQGPFRLDASASAMGQAIKLQGIVDEVKPRRAIPLRVDVMAAAAKWHVDGLVLRDTGKGPVLKVAVEMTAPDMAKSLQALGQASPDILAGVPLKWVGDLRADARKGAFRDGRLSLGGDDVATDMQWSLDGDRPIINMNFAAKHIQLDAWTKIRTAALAAQVPDIMWQGRLIPEAHAQTTVLPAFELPTLPHGLDVNLKAQADVITWRGQSVQGAALDVVLSGGDLVLNRLSADLPGAASASVLGYVGASQQPPTVDLTLDGRAANLRATLAWLGVDVSRVPADRLRKAELAMAVSLASDGLIQLRNIKAALDASHATGAANLRLGAYPAVGLSLTVDQVNVDAYRLQDAQQAALRGADPKVVYAASPVASTQHSADPFGLSRLVGANANVNILVQRLLAGDQAFEDVRLQGTVQGGDVTISNASAALGRLGQVSMSGKLLQQGQNLPLLQDIKLGVKSSNGGKLLALLPGDIPDFAKSWRALSATINLDGPLSNVATNALLDVGKTRIHGVGGFNLITGEPAETSSVSLTAPALGDVAQVFGGSVAPDIAKLGKVTAKLPLQKTQNGFASPKFSLKAGALAVTGSVDANMAQARPYITASIKGNTLPLIALAENDAKALTRPLILPASYTPAAAQTGTKAEPWAVLRDMDGQLTAKFDEVRSPKLRAKNVKVTAKLAQGILTLSQADASVFGGQVNLNGQADLRQTPKLTGALTAKNVSIRKDNPLFGASGAPLTGVVSFTANGAATGVSKDALLRGLSGQGEFQVQNGTFLGANLDEVNRLLQNIRSVDDVLRAIQAGQSGRTRFDDLSGKFAVTNGVVKSDRVTLTAPSGRGGVTGSANLFAKTMDVRADYALASLKDAPPIGVRLDGAWQDPRVFFDIKAFQGYVLQRGIGQFLNLLGKKKGATSTTQPSPSAEDATAPQSNATESGSQPSQQKLEVKDVLRGLLQAIPQN